MEILWKNVQSKEKPLEIDITSSPGGVYYRRNIKEVFVETEEEITSHYEYQETFMTLNEWEKYQMNVLGKELNNEDNSKEYEDYQTKLNQAIEYINGKFYKPSWHKIYSSIMDEFDPKFNLYKLAGGDITPFISKKVLIFDATGKFENAVEMTIKEIIELWYFLYEKKEEYYLEYKRAKEQEEELEVVEEE